MLSPRPFVVVIALTALAACPTPAGGEGERDGDACDVVVPATWIAPDWEAHAVEALALRAQLDTLTGATTMRGAELSTAGVVVDDIGDLTGPFQAGALSLQTITSANTNGVVSDAFAEFLELLAAGPQSLVDAGGQWAPGASGGLYGSSPRGINEGGLEMRQIVDKSLFAGSFYAYALALTAGAIDVATIDAISAAWGNNSKLDPTLVLADSADYTHAMGFHAEAVGSLIAARAYAADAACNGERDAAIVAFFRTWEKSMYARFVHYANVCAVEAAAADDDDGFAGAIHELSEGAGLALGFHGLANPASGPLAGGARVVTDAQLEVMMTTIGVDIADLGASTTGALVSQTVFDGPVTTLEGLVGAALSLDVAEVDGFAEPTEG
ncbi:MAG: hypothetical protein Q8O67_30635 [Deltaproteobacteria bacterium]|nr:hypothetical protein [Deltaproteobacteria bacterium]